MSEEESTPTTARRQLGAHLRRLRQQRGLTVDKVAELIGAAASQVSRIEKGSRTLSPEYEVQIFDLYGVAPDDADVLKALADAGRRRVTRSAAPTNTTDYVKIEQTTFVELERDAVRIREFNSGHIPGLLQTEAYMRASMSGTAPDVDGQAIDNAVRVRKARQRKLADGTKYEAVVDAAAIARQVGGAGVMRAQAEALRSAIVSGRVHLCVIPFEVGAHPGLNSQFVALTLPSEDVPNAVFSEGLFGHMQFDKPADVERFDRVWDRLSALVESRQATLDRLSRLSSH